MVIAEDKSLSVERVLGKWKERGIRNVRFELPDMHGTSRSKIIPIDHAASYAKNGLNMYGGAAVLDYPVGCRPGHPLQRGGRVRRPAAAAGPCHRGGRAMGRGHSAVHLRRVVA